MDREVATDAVTGAVRIIKALFPKCNSRQHVDVLSARAFRETCGSDRNHAFENKRERTDRFRFDSADCNRAGDVGCAVAILCTRIDQIKLTIFEFAIGIGVDAIMDNCAVWACSGNRIEGKLFERHLEIATSLVAACFQLLRGRDFINCARCLTVKPGQETDHGHAITLVGGAGAVEFSLVLNCAGQAGGGLAVGHATTSGFNCKAQLFCS